MYFEFNNIQPPANLIENKKRKFKYLKYKIRKNGLCNRKKIVSWDRFLGYTNIFGNLN